MSFCYVVARWLRIIYIRLVHGIICELFVFILTDLAKPRNANKPYLYSIKKSKKETNSYQMIA